MLAKKVAKGAGWMIATRVMGNVFGVLSLLVIARLLSPEDIGLFAISFGVMMIVTSVLELPASLIIIQMEDPTKEDFSTVFVVNLVRGLILFVLVAGAAWPLSIVYDDPRLVWLTLALSIYPLLLCLRNPYFETYARDVRFGPAAFVEVAAKFMTFGASVGVALVYPSYWALAAGQIAFALTSVAVTYLMPVPRPGLSLKSFQKIWSFSIWIALGAFCRTVQLQSDKLILGGVYGPKLLGWYAISIQIVEQFLAAISGALRWAFYSGFSRMNKDKARLRSAYALAQQSMCSVMVPAGIGILLVAEPLVNVMLGPGWEPSVKFVRYAAAAETILLFSSASWALGTALGETKLVFIWRVIVTALKIGVQLIGLLVAGITGFLVAMLISNAIAMVLWTRVVRGLIDLSIKDQLIACWRPAAASGLMAIGILTLQSGLEPACMASAEMVCSLQANLLALVLQVSAGAAIYFISLVILWLLCGQPDGAEQRVMSALTEIKRSLQRRFASAE